MATNNIKLSIIIPYFETYEMTIKLLKELAIQQTDEIEIIVIDDCCKKELYWDINTCKDDNLLYGMKLIEHKENQGVAKSRNEGIEIAKGKYIGFIDSDDQITMDYISTLLEAIDNYDTDVINFNWYDMTSHEEIKKPSNPAVWKAIYKKETIPTFLENYEYGHEDVFFTDEIMNGKYTITYLDKLLYFYNSNRNGSLIWKKTHKEVK